MAHSTSTYYSNSIVGTPEVAGEIDFTVVDSVPKFPVGVKFEDINGRVFRYAHFGAATSAGELCSTDVSESCLAYTPTACCNAIANYQQPDETPGVYPSAKGSRYLTLCTGATGSASQYDGGYVTIALGAGKGYTYRIKKSGPTPIIAGSGTGFLKLYDPIQVSVSSDSSISIAGCRFSNLEATSDHDALAAGVPRANVDTAGYWGWLQVRGLVTVYCDAGSQHILPADATYSNLPGALACISTLTAGAVDALMEISTAKNGDFGSSTAGVVGYFVNTMSNGTLATIKLRVE